jgi:hypothetical protein
MTPALKHARASAGLRSRRWHLSGDIRLDPAGIGVIHRPQERRIQAPLSITKAFRVVRGDGAFLQGLIKVDGTFA